MEKKKYFIAGLCIIILVAGWFYYQYQRPRADVTSITASYLLSADKIYQDFTADETTANKKYVGKVVEITGSISEARVTDSTAAVLLAAGDVGGGVNCSLQKQEGIAPVKGQTITIKGRCTGFLMDVNLTEAVIVK